MVVTVYRELSDVKNMGNRVLINLSDRNTLHSRAEIPRTDTESALLSSLEYEQYRCLNFLRF